MPVVVVLVAAAAGFGWVCVGLPDRGGARPWWFLAGIVVLAAALVSPVHGWSERALAGHMVQHVLLISLAAPLLAAARPFASVATRFHLDGVAPRPGRTRPALTVELARWPRPVSCRSVCCSGGTSHCCSTPRCVIRRCTISNTSRCWRPRSCSAPRCWHDVGRGSDRVVRRHLAGDGLGVALTLAADAWYAAYPSLRDQQLAGVVMWAYGGTLAVGAGVVLALDWLRRAERNTPGWAR